MINIESLVFDTVYNQLSVLHPTANISAGYDEKNAVYPSVVVREIGNVPFVNGNTDDCAENYTRVTFEVEVISSKTGTARSECKAILANADAIMQSMKFKRTYTSQAFNIDRSVFRQYARYEAIVGKPIADGDNTVFQMYRR